MFRKKHYLGQNFLKNPDILKKIIKASNLNSDDIVYELGAGTGYLTKLLAKECKKLIAIEKDIELKPILQEKFKNQTNIEFKFIDIRDLNILHSNVKIIGNIPYYLTKYILTTILIENYDKINLSVLTIPKDIAKKLIANPGEIAYSYLTVFIKLYFQVEYISTVKAKEFLPPPKIDSAIIRLTKTCEYQDLKNDVYFIDFLKNVFKQRRKRLKNNLKYINYCTKEKIKEVYDILNLKEELRSFHLDLQTLEKVYKFCHKK